MSDTESISFEVDAADEGEGVRIAVTASDATSRTYELPGREAQHYYEFFRGMCLDFGTRMPHVFAETLEFPDASAQWQPLLTENVSPRILAGYGDPAVLKADDGYYLLATSNDAPDAFPILRSDDLIHWEH